MGTQKDKLEKDVQNMSLQNESLQRELQALKASLQDKQKVRIYITQLHVILIIINLNLKQGRIILFFNQLDMNTR